MTTIARNINGIVDFCITQVEELADTDDISLDKKAKIALGYLREARSYALLNLQHKKLLISAPDVAKNTDIVLSIGTQPAGLAPLRGDPS